MVGQLAKVACKRGEITSTSRGGRCVSSAVLAFWWPTTLSREERGKRGTGHKWRHQLCKDSVLPRAKAACTVEMTPR